MRRLLNTDQDLPVTNPEALEQLDRSTIRLWHSLWITTVIIFIWMSLFPLDIVSFAQGEVQPHGKILKVNHLEGGILQSVAVAEGEAVQAGQVLLSLSPIQSGADAGEINARKVALQASLWRLQAEDAQRSSINYPPEFTSGNPTLVNSNNALFRARIESLRNAEQTQQSEISARQQEAAEISARLSSTRKRLLLAEEQRVIGERLLAQSLSNRYEHIEREKEVGALQSRIREDEAALRRVQEITAKARSELQGLRVRYAAQVREEMAQTTQQLEEVSKRSEGLDDTLNRTQVTAPAAGVIKSLHYSNPGTVIPPGGQVVDIVPADAAMLIEARLNPGDIGHIRLGQTALLQLATSEATFFGRMEGKVEFISPDSVHPQQGPSYFPIRVSIPQPYFSQGDQRYPLLPGVPITVGIVTGQRSVLAYLLAPLLGNTLFAATER